MSHKRDNFGQKQSFEAQSYISTSRFSSSIFASKFFRLFEPFILRWVLKFFIIYMMLQSIQRIMPENIHIAEEKYDRPTIQRNTRISRNNTR